MLSRSSLFIRQHSSTKRPNRNKYAIERHLLHVKSWQLLREEGRDSMMDDITIGTACYMKVTRRGSHVAGPIDKDLEHPRVANVINVLSQVI